MHAVSKKEGKKERKKPDEHGMGMVDGWEGTGHGREMGEVRGEGAVVTAAGGGADIEDIEGDGLQHWHLCGGSEEEGAVVMSVDSAVGGEGGGEEEEEAGSVGGGG